MKVEQLKELGFELIDEYVHGDNDEFVTQVFRKNNLEICLDFNKKTGKYLWNDFKILEDQVSNITFEELKQLDKILNK